MDHIVFVFFRYAERRARSFPYDSPRETSDDVQCHAGQRDPSRVQEVHARCNYFLLTSCSHAVYWLILLPFGQKSRSLAALSWWHLASQPWQNTQAIHSTFLQSVWWLLHKCGHDQHDLSAVGMFVAWCKAGWCCWIVCWSGCTGWFDVGLPLVCKICGGAYCLVIYLAMYSCLLVIVWYSWALHILIVVKLAKGNLNMVFTWEVLWLLCDLQ